MVVKTIMARYIKLKEIRKTHRFTQVALSEKAERGLRFV